MPGSANLRLFTGISIPPETLELIETTLRNLRPLASLKWSPRENFHITTKFIGAWPEARLPELKDTLGHVPASGPFPISIRGFGFYPSPQRAKVFFAVIHGGPPLAILAQETDAALAKLGCALETRPYSPHLTLARIRNENIGELTKQIALMADTDFGTFTAAEFQLFRSTPGPQGSVYTSLACFGLDGRP